MNPPPHTHTESGEAGRGYEHFRESTHFVCASSTLSTKATLSSDDQAITGLSTKIMSLIRQACISWYKLSHFREMPALKLLFMQDYREDQQRDSSEVQPNHLYRNQSRIFWPT